MTTTFNFDKTRIVSASWDPQKWGSVTGAGSYDIDSDVTLTATANEGSKFDKWVDENGEQKSTDATYTFKIKKEDVVLKAIFIPYKNTTVTVPTGAEYKLTQYLGG